MMMTIGEVATRTGVRAKTIRYYEQTGLIGRAGRGPNFYPTCSDNDVAMLGFIGRAHRLFSNEDLKSLIALYRGRSRSSRDVRAVAAQHLRRVEHKIRELKTIRGVLADLIERVPITTPIARSSQT